MTIIEVLEKIKKGEDKYFYFEDAYVNPEDGLPDTYYEPIVVNSRFDSTQKEILAIIAHDRQHWNEHYAGRILTEVSFIFLDSTFEILKYVK